MQPFTGARDGGPFGLVKGIGMGLTGFVLKDMAAIFGPLGYTFKGVHKELRKSKQPTKAIRKARMMQGRRDLGEIEDGEKRAIEEKVAHGWNVVQQVWAIMQETRAQGLKGRVKVMRETKTWKANGAFETVEMAEKALNAMKTGKSLERAFAQRTEELRLAQRPRKNAVRDLE